MQNKSSFVKLGLIIYINVARKWFFVCSQIWHSSHSFANIQKAIEVNLSSLKLSDNKESHIRPLSLFKRRSRAKVLPNCVLLQGEQIALGLT